MSHTEEWHRNQGGVAGDWHGVRIWENYGDPGLEYEAGVQRRGVAELTWRTLIELSGEDRQTWLQGLVTQDVASLSPGDVTESAMLSSRGRTVAHFRVIARESTLWIQATAACHEALMEELDRYLFAEDVEIEDLTGTWGQLAILPPADGSATRITTPLPSWDRIRGCQEQIVQHEFMESTLESPGLQPIGHDTYNILRIEQGAPWFGVDIDPEIIPVEAGLASRTISYTKGCYVGQEVISRIQTRGHVNRTLTGLRLEAGPLPSAGTRLFLGDKDVGWITSAVESPRHGPLGLGYVHRKAREAASLAYESGRRASMVEMPIT